ncbi:hypothetical protein, partial [Rhizobium esperanzae]
MLLFKLSSRNFIRTVFVGASFITALFLADKTFFYDWIANRLGPEAFKLALQFLLITVLGGALSAFV